MFGRVTFYPTLAYNIALEKLSVRKWYSRIDETVVLGALPWRTIAPQVRTSSHHVIISHFLMSTAHQ